MTHSEENYLKVIYHRSCSDFDKEVSTNVIAEALQTKASSVTDMLKKMAEKGWIEYRKYQGASLSEEGKKIALNVIRKHRLWEVFLVEKLNFSWDEIHEVAEQLEHIESDKLIEELDKFLQYPDTDPHGDPIPDKDGNMPVQQQILLSELSENQKGLCIGVKNTTKDFLQYLDKIQISIGDNIQVISIQPFDNSYQIMVGKEEKSISSLIAKNIYVKKI